MPLARLLDPDAHRRERREAYGMLVDVHYFTLGGETIWGATARILSELVAVWRAL